MSRFGKRGLVTMRTTADCARADGLLGEGGARCTAELWQAVENLTGLASIHGWRGTS